MLGRVAEKYIGIFLLLHLIVVSSCLLSFDYFDRRITGFLLGDKNVANFLADIF